MKVPVVALTATLLVTEGEALNVEDASALDTAQARRVKFAQADSQSQVASASSAKSKSKSKCPDG